MNHDLLVFDERLVKFLHDETSHGVQIDVAVDKVALVAFALDLSERSKGAEPALDLDCDVS